MPRPIAWRSRIWFDLPVFELKMKAGLLRRLKLKYLQIKINLASACKGRQPFTKEQFLSDCADNSLIIKAIQGAIKPGRFTIKIHDEPKPLATVTKVPEQDYYFLEISQPALLEPCFDFLTPKIETYFKRHASSLDVERDLFHRMCMTCASMMVYYHEAAHILCGHLDYEEVKGELPIPDWTADPASFKPWFNAAVHPVLPIRTRELDADIHGAQFSLGHAMHACDAVAKVRRKTFLQAYTIGVRGLFEYLTWGAPHDTPAAAIEHPAPITRAYVAITHAVARMDEMGVSRDEIGQLQQFALEVLLEFESRDLGLTVNADVLQTALATELELWSRRHKEFAPFQPKSAKRKRAQQ